MLRSIERILTASPGRKPLDRADAPREILRRRWAKGITKAEAAELDRWSEHGYVIFGDCIPVELIDRALEDLDTAWREKRRLMIETGTGFAADREAAHAHV